MGKISLRNNAKILVVLGLIGILLVIGFIFSDRFRTVQNLRNVYEQSAALAFVALGQTVVILTGGIDLTFDSQIALLSSLLSGVIDGQTDRVALVVLGGFPLRTAGWVANGGLLLLLCCPSLLPTPLVAAI